MLFQRAICVDPRCTACCWTSVIHLMERCTQSKYTSSCNPSIPPSPVPRPLPPLLPSPSPPPETQGERRANCHPGHSYCRHGNCHPTTLNSLFTPPPLPPPLSLRLLPLQKYKESGVPTVILAGAEYGSGSSRDWAAKGPYLQVTNG